MPTMNTRAMDVVCSQFRVDAGRSVKEPTETSAVQRKHANRHNVPSHNESCKQDSTYTNCGPTSPSDPTAAAAREALLLKLDWRRKFKLLPFKHNGSPHPLPLNTPFSTANTSLLLRDHLSNTRRRLFLESR